MIENSLTQLQDVFLKTAADFPDKIALEINRETFTYRQLYNLVVQFASKLAASGLQSGERVLICSGNSLETIVAFWSILVCKATVTLYPDNYSAEKLNYVLHDSGAKIIILTDQQSAQVANLLDPANTIKIYTRQDLLLASSSGQSESLANEQSYSYSHKESGEKSKFCGDSDNEVNPTLSLAAIIYTSGSTGEPKGVMLTHRNMLSALQAILMYLNYQTDDRILCVLPLSFDYGLYQMIMCFTVGARIIVLKNALFGMEVLQTLKTNEITVLPGVPTLFGILHEYAQHLTADFLSVRLVTNTGATLHIKMIERIQNLFPQAKLFSMYGLTECKRCTYLPYQRLKDKPNSVGIAIPNSQVWIIDSSGKKLDPYQIGQIVVRGPHIMQGYWNKPTATSKRLKWDEQLDEWLLLTEDYGYLDEESFLYFKGRMDDVIKYHGMKLIPVEIESAIQMVQGVKEVAFCSVSFAEEQDALIVYICANEHINLTLLQQQIVKQIAMLVKLDYIVFAEKLPKTFNGKIDKRLLGNIAQREMIQFKKQKINMLNSYISMIELNHNNQNDFIFEKN